jgi:hypothetical protein
MKFCLLLPLLLLGCCQLCGQHLVLLLLRCKCSLLSDQCLVLS